MPKIIIEVYRSRHFFQSKMRLAEERFKTVKTVKENLITKYPIELQFIFCIDVFNENLYFLYNPKITLFLIFF